MADFGIHELDRLLSQATASVQAARAHSGPVDLDAVAVGEAADGQIRATVRGGRLDAVTIEPPVTRFPTMSWRGTSSRRSMPHLTRSSAGRRRRVRSTRPR